MNYFLLSLLLGFAGVVIFFLYRAMLHWQHLYLEAKSNYESREAHFLDQLLVRNSLRPTSMPFEAANTASQAPVPPRESGDDEMRILEDRVVERVEVGMMTPLAGQELIRQLRSGELSKAELDMQLWTAQRGNLPSSEQPDYEF